jgi:spermidine synthase
VTLLLAVVFVLSGAAGLIYESIWSRYLGLFVGHSAYAQVIVLVIFLGGMSAGAALVSRRSATLKEPLLWYAAIEAAVGLLGLAFHWVYGGVTAFAYDSIFPALADGGLLGPVKWTIAALLILPQSVLLGATFPLMSAGVLRRLRREGDAAPTASGRVLAILYFANSLGAAVGVLLAGFVLIRDTGLPGTLVTAAVINLIVAATTFAAVRFAPDEEDDLAQVMDSAVSGELSSSPVAAPPPAPGPMDPRDPTSATLEPDALWRLLLAVSFGTAVASFIYEIAWVRMLSLVLGSATHSFELMLSAFILGLALGAFWVRKRADRVRDPLRMLGFVQFAMGTLAIGTLIVYTDSFHWMASLIAAVDETDSGYRFYNLARYGISLAVMLPPTFCAGITLPLITRMLLSAGHGERAIGAVYAWNTLGSILGVTAAALWLMPLLGLRGVLILGGAVDIAIGVWIIWKRAGDSAPLRQTALLASVAGAVVVGMTAMSPGLDEGILTSGVFRYGTVPGRGEREVVFYADGRTATVSVRLGGDSAYSLATNGKPDASMSATWFGDPPAEADRKPLKGDESTQILLPLVTLAHAPNTRNAAVIGHGSGISSHFLLGSQEVERLVTIDIEPQMIEAARLFLPANLRAYDDPRSHFVHDDAKSFFAASAVRYDLILSEPSNPWVSGVSGLFTDEFYARVRGYLSETGVFGQWLHLYEIDDELVLTVLSALHRNFPSYAVYLTNDVDILVVASNQPTLPKPDWSVFAREEIALDLARFAPVDADALDRTLLITRAELAPLLDSGGVPANSDFAPILDLGAERTRFLRNRATGFLGLSSDRWDVAAALDERRVPLAPATAPALSLDRIEDQALAARLRSGERLAPDDTAIVNRAFQAARLRGERLAQGIATNRPPADWFHWFNEMLAVEDDLHAGTMGEVDGAWYAGVERYMVTHRAPSDGISALRMLRAGSTYDWTTAARESQVLVDARNRGRVWFPADLFLDMSVVARLKVGDFNGARALLSRLQTGSDRETNDVRLRLLDAHVARVETAMSR